MLEVHFTSDFFSVTVALQINYFYLVNCDYLIGRIQIDFYLFLNIMHKKLKLNKMMEKKSFKN